MVVNLTDEGGVDRPTVGVEGRARRSWGLARMVVN